MKITNAKKEDITKYVILFLENKLSKKEFKKLTNLK